MPAATTEAEDGRFIPTRSLAVLDTGGANLRVWLFDGPATPAAFKAAASGALDGLRTDATDVLILPNLAARPRVGNDSSTLSSRTYLAGPEIGEQVGVYARLQLRSPIERGFITDWAAQTLSWSTALRYASASQNRESLSGKSRESPAGLGKRTRRTTTDTPEPAGEEKPEPPQANRRKSSIRTAPEAVGQPWAGPGQAPLLWGRTVLVTEPYFNMPELASAMDTLLFEEYGAAAVLRASPAELAAWCLRVPPAKAITDVGGKEDVSDEDITSPPPPEAEAEPGRETAPVAPPVRARGKRKRSAVDKAEGTVAAMKSLPETTLVLDCGHSYCHAVPLVRGRVVWGAVKRLDFGGKHVTNLLKTSLSFGQWDLSEDTWLVGKVKERTSFVAASAGPSQRREARTAAQAILEGKSAVPPYRWSFATLTELSKLASTSSLPDPLALEYVLPDYSLPSLPPPSPESREQGSTTPSPASQVSGLPTPLTLERIDQSTFCARYGTIAPAGSGASEREKLPLSSKAWSPAEKKQYICPPRPLSGRKKVALSAPAPAAHGSAPGGAGEEEAQTLRLTTDRFVHTENFFAPTRVPGLGHPFEEQLGLARLALAAASEAEQLVLHRELRGGRRTTREKGAGTGLLLANVLLVGGAACIPNLAERLEEELRPLAPEATPVRVRVPLNPISAAAEGGAIFLLASLAQVFPAHRAQAEQAWQAQALADLPGRFTTRQGYLDRVRGT